MKRGEGEGCGDGRRGGSVAGGEFCDDCLGCHGGAGESFWDAFVGKSPEFSS